MKLIPTVLAVMCLGLALPANAAPNAPEPKSTTAHPKCGKGYKWDAKAGNCFHTPIPVGPGGKEGAHGPAPVGPGGKAREGA